MSIIQTDTHAFFWHGALSQWHLASFRAPLWQHGPELSFNCAEQYMMASKAIMFGDVFGDVLPNGKYVPSALEAIMDAKTPRDQKALGRRVKNFDETRWNAMAKSIVFRASLFKFNQVNEAFDKLLSTEKRMLVEGSPYDRIWGVGLAYDDPRIKDPANWNGTNWLGEVLTALKEVYDSQINDFNIWTMNPFSA